MKSLPAGVKSFVANLLRWSFFVGRLATSSAAGAVLDGAEKVDGAKGITAAPARPVLSISGS
ncbi:hypothetical protein [Streptomyces sp. 2A115]|uniref:hypothetical protein n=1 Tax=Streptomyces sp. 2A115 TaxID=3457439 RepID=UPI003FD16BA0